MTGRGIKGREGGRGLKLREEGGFFWKSDPKPRWLDLKLDRLLLDRNRQTFSTGQRFALFRFLPFFPSLSFPFLPSRIGTQNR